MSGADCPGAEHPFDRLLDRYGNLHTINGAQGGADDRHPR